MTAMPAHFIPETASELYERIVVAVRQAQAWRRAMTTDLAVPADALRSDVRYATGRTYFILLMFRSYP